MVRLRNLKKSDKIGECDIIPEDSKQAGHITVNLNSEKLEEIRSQKGMNGVKIMYIMPQEIWLLF